MAPIGKLAKLARSRLKLALSLTAALALAAPAVASADSVGPFDFEQPTFKPGNIDQQGGWSRLGDFDAEVADVSEFSDASGYGFGEQALRISNARQTTSLSDQTTTPTLPEGATESGSLTLLEASFAIGTTEATQQPGLSIQASPTGANTSRMSFLRFDDEADGVHVTFADAVNPGPVGTVTEFPESEIAVLDRSEAHSIRLSMELVPGPDNDVVEVYVDGELAHTGGSWEDYYRYDPEQKDAGNVVPASERVVFPARGDADVTGVEGEGFLIDDLAVSAEAAPEPEPEPEPEPSPEPSPEPNPPAAEAPAPQPAPPAPRLAPRKGPVASTGARPFVGALGCAAERCAVGRRVAVIGIAGRKIRIGVQVPRRFGAGQPAVVRIRLPRGVRRALARGRRAQAVIRLRVRDSDGRVVVRRLRVRFVPPRAAGRRTPGR